LKWQTATEVNNYGFEIERQAHPNPSQREGLSLNPLRGDWGAIGFVNGSGNSNSPIQYNFIDSKIAGIIKNPENFNGVLQYRLKQIDNDGTFKYSNIVEVTFNLKPSAFELFQNYPNPFNPTTTIQYSIPQIETGLPAGGGSSLQHVTLKVYDVLGREVAALVNEQKAPGNYEVNFDGSKLVSGIYIYKLQAGRSTETKKFILMK